MTSRYIPPSRRTARTRALIAKLKTVQVEAPIPPSELKKALRRIGFEIWWLRQKVRVMIVLRALYFALFRR